jgi:hypothetical protein
MAKKGSIPPLEVAADNDKIFQGSKTLAGSPAEVEEASPSPMPMRCSGARLEDVIPSLISLETTTISSEEVSA